MHPGHRFSQKWQLCVKTETQAIMWRTGGLSYWGRGWGSLDEKWAGGGGQMGRGQGQKIWILNGGTRKKKGKKGRRKKLGGVGGLNPGGRGSRPPHFHASNQRCVVRGIRAFCLTGSRLNSRGSSVAPTCADPEAEASTGQFTRVWSGGRVLRGGATLSIVSDVSPGHAGRRAWTRASESSQPAAQTSCPKPARRVSFAWVRR